MTTGNLHSSELLKRVLFDLPRGMAVTSRHLKEMGVSRQLAYRYTKHGWLESLGYGYFLRVKDTLTDRGATASLQHNGVNIHIGGKSALTLRGFLHYVRNDRAPLTLYGHKTQGASGLVWRAFSVLFVERNTLRRIPCSRKKALCLSL